MQTQLVSTPKIKHPPKGVTLLYEDKEIIVVDKPPGLLTIGTDRDKSRTVHSALNDYVRKGNPKSNNRVYIVHRLDQDTSGILLFAKSEQSKQFLQNDWENTQKIYLAVVNGRMNPPDGTISSYLTENAAFHVYSTTDQNKGKFSTTKYYTIKEQKGVSLLRIHLLTGRKHQIRVHFSEKGHPVVGDRKYGKGGVSSANLFLHSYSIAFNHPTSRDRMNFETVIPQRFTQIMGTFSIAETMFKKSPVC